MHWMMSGKRADTGEGSKVRQGQRFPSPLSHLCYAASAQGPTVVSHRHLRPGDERRRQSVSIPFSCCCLEATDRPLFLARRGPRGIPPSAASDDRRERRRGTYVGDDLLEHDLLLCKLLVALLAHAAPDAGVGLLELGSELLDLASGWRGEQGEEQSASPGVAPSTTSSHLVKRWGRTEELCILS